MGEIFVKKNNAFERVVSDGNTVIITGGGGGGGDGVTISFYAHRNEQDGDVLIPASATSAFPSDGQEGAGISSIILRNLSKYLDRVVTNTSSISGQPFDSDTGEFTAQVAGVYRFSATVGVAGGSTSSLSDGFFLWIRKNGSLSGVTNRNSNRVGMLYKVVYAGADSNDPVPRLTAHQTWEIELAVGDKIVLWGGWGPGIGAFESLPFVYDASFSGSYVGGASVTPRDPVAVYAYTGANLYPNNADALRIRNSVLSSASPNPSFAELVDPSSAFNPITGIFTAPVTGIYNIGFSAIEQDREQGYNYYWIVKTASGTTIADTFNGSVESSAPYAPLNYYGTYVRESYYTTEENPTGGSWIVQLNVGDKITWHCSRYVTAEDGSGDNSIYNIALSAHLLTSTQTIGVSTDVSFFARNEAASEGALPDLAQNTPYYLSKQQLSGSLSQTIVVQDNVNSCYSQTTGEFTAPISGMYEFEGRLSGYHNLSDSRSDAFVWFEKNAPTTPAAGADPYSRTNRVSSVSRDGGSFAVATRFGASIKEHLSLVAGDRIVLCGMSGGYGINHDWSFSGKLLRRA